MKALLVDISAPQRARLFADSAIGRCATPLFVPDVCAPWSGRVMVAVRIGRLGKNIAPNFSSRYIDGISAVHVMQSQKAENLVYITDNAIIQGEYLPLSSLEGNITLTVAQAEHTTTLDIDLSELDIANTLSRLSELTTFKTGDILIFSTPGVDTNLENNKDSYISAALDGRQCINFKVK